MSKIDAAFLLLLNHGSELLMEMRRGEQRIEGALKTKVDAFASSLAQAMNVAKFAQTPQNTVSSNGGVFDGGPVSAGAATTPEPVPASVELSVEEQHKADVQAGEDLAKANQPLPDSASPSVRQGYHAIKPPDDPESVMKPFESDPAPEEAPVITDGSPAASAALSTELPENQS